mgnify:FL=1
MNADDLVFPDFSDHPPAPKLSFEQYADWIFNEIIPELHRRGEMTKEKLLADFMKNEGRMTSMPDFSWLKKGKKDQAGD